MEYARGASNDTSIDDNILRCMNWLLGTNAQVYLGNLATPQFGAFAQFPGGVTDFGGPNLMIGAGYVGAFRASAAANWQTATQNLLSRRTRTLPRPRLETRTSGTAPMHNFSAPGRTFWGHCDLSRLFCASHPAGAFRYRRMLNGTA